MKRFLKIILAFSTTFIATVSFAREIAFTFDDAPLPDSALMSGDNRTEKLISALHSAKVPDVLFFVTTNNINTKSRERLIKYANAGFHLANNSHSRISANTVSANDYLTDAYRAHLVLKEFNNVLPFHRFPFLHYGADNKSIEQIQAGLRELGYQDGYVTIDNFDWAINAIMVKAAEQKRSIDYKKASDIYVNTMEQSIEFFDAIARQNLKRSPKHVLLLHENDAAALFIPDLIARLRSKGWKIITPQNAYKDPIAAHLPKTLFQLQGRVAAIAASKGKPENELRHISEDMNYLQTIFEEQKVFGPIPSS